MQNTRALLRAGKAGVLGMLAFFVSWSCARDRIQREADPESVRGEILRVCPVGGEVGAASRFLTDDGFVCSPSAGSFARTDRTGPYIYCDRSRNTGFLMARRIQIALFHHDGKLVEVVVTAGLIGP